jgi:hypothetical protein
MSSDTESTGSDTEGHATRMKPYHDSLATPEDAIDGNITEADGFKILDEADTETIEYVDAEGSGSSFTKAD